MREGRLFALKGISFLGQQALTMGTNRASKFRVNKGLSFGRSAVLSSLAVFAPLILGSGDALAATGETLSPTSQQVNVTDCTGSTQLVTRLEGDTGATFSFPKNNTSTSQTGFWLENTITGERRTAEFSGDDVEFEGITTGTWKLCPADSNFDWATASLDDADVDSVVPAAVAVVGAAGATIGIAASNSSSSGDGTTTTTESTGSVGSTTPLEAAPDNGVAGDGDAATSSNDSSAAADSDGDSSGHSVGSTKDPLDSSCVRVRRDCLNEEEPEPTRDVLSRFE